jgi:hypothetical protein
MRARLAEDTVDPRERAGLVVALAAEAGDPAIRGHILRLYDDPSTRAQALKAMGLSLDKTFAPHFPPHLDDPDPKVRLEAVSGVGYLEIRSELARLERFFAERDVRPVALFAYALAAPARISRADLRILVRKIENLAGGFTEDDEEAVQTAVDLRLHSHGIAPLFRGRGNDEEFPERAAPATSSSIGRNDPCPCGSGRKYKKCCGA